jgi:hypothetical protein
MSSPASQNSSRRSRREDVLLDMDRYSSRPVWPAARLASLPGAAPLHHCEFTSGIVSDHHRIDRILRSCACSLRIIQKGEGRLLRLAEVSEVDTHVIFESDRHLERSSGTSACGPIPGHGTAIKLPTNASYVTSLAAGHPRDARGSDYQAQARATVPIRAVRPAPKNSFDELHQGDPRSVSLAARKFPFLFSENVLLVRHPTSVRGAYRPIVTTREVGKRWPHRTVRRTAVRRTAKSCGPGIPVLMPSATRLRVVAIRGQ